MCGIFCSVYSRNDERSLEKVWTGCKKYLASRGLDYSGEWRDNVNKETSCFFAANILWTQGKNLFKQPCTDDQKNVLLWNGDVFSGNLCSDLKSDTQMVLESLEKSTNHHEIVKVLEQIRGPFSFIYFRKSKNMLYFGRDLIGRHSLLIDTSLANNTLILSSVLTKQEASALELPSIGVFSLDITNWKLSLIPWKKTENTAKNIEELKRIWQEPIKIIEGHKKNICEAKRIYEESEYSKIINMWDFSNKQTGIMERLLESEGISERVGELLKLLHESVGTRVSKQPKICKFCFGRNEMKECLHSKIGIAFSGGLDSTLLALIADKFIPAHESIDLINVAFEHKSGYDVPDRITGRQSLSELVELCPGRSWNFIEVNVTRDELDKCRSSRIADLVHPTKTIMDESMGCAVWFASRGKGEIRSKPYESSCRIMLFGMGADELFGGYMRHRTTLKHQGWEALHQELDHEIQRISIRNLGRDDRVASDHSRQPRYPYLDEKIVDFATDLAPWDRCWPTEKMGSGFGDKLLLRLAALKLRLRNAANFPKRAFQFGSRIANSKENARDVSTRL